MRIGIDARIAYYSGGGIRSYVVHLLESLASLDRETDYRILYSRKDGDSAPLGPNFHPVACWTPSHHRFERWALGVEISRLGLDLLHSPDFIPPAFGYGQSVITIHDLNFLYYPRFLTAESRRHYNEQIEWAVERADHILADSQATKTDLTSVLNVPSEKITVVHLAADPSFRVVPDVEAAQTAERYALEPGFLLFVGTLEPRKNVPGLLRAYRILLDERVTAEPLVLVGGKGWLYEEIFDQVEVLELSEQVRFLDRVPDADLPGLYGAASVLASPSFYEGFGLPALEAMSCGTPVVVADRASLPEVVGGAGILVDPEDPEDIARALKCVLTEEPLRARMAERGLERASGFSWSRVAEETLNVYRQVLTG
ncbi:MAG: glycosyltransferase family 1 protein [Chloroflexota bacterium]|nr:glycosyltransferase family 1 protein [Chloroflexota bacterium]